MLIAEDRPGRPRRDPTRRRARAALAAAAALPFLARPAAGHVGPSPRENNRYILIAPLGDRLRLSYTVYMGEQPGRAARARMDADRDGRIDPGEAERYGAEVAAEVAPRLELELDGRSIAIEWQDVDVGLGQPLTDGGAFAVDLVAWICFESPRERLAHRVRFRDRFRVPDPGETELTAEESPGVRITRSELGPKRGSAAVRLAFRWSGGPGPAESDGYRLEFEVDPALATFTGESCDAAGAGEGPAGAGSRRGWLIGGGAALLALAGAAALVRRRIRR
jgi:hypothetical protein